MNKLHRAARDRVRPDRPHFLIGAQGMTYAIVPNTARAAKHLATNEFLDTQTDRGVLYVEHRSIARICMELRASGFRLGVL